jgi:hypothetical protein
MSLGYWWNRFLSWWYDWPSWRVIYDDGKRSWHLRYDDAMTRAELFGGVRLEYARDNRGNLTK